MICIIAKKPYVPEANENRKLVKSYDMYVNETTRARVPSMNNKRPESRNIEQYDNRNKRPESART